MAATELLDYNQVQEQSPSTGDSIPQSGGPIIWQFRADPNLAWDPSQSFFAMDVTIRARKNSDGNCAAAYEPGPHDLRPFFPLRCFDGMSHVIDGVTVASTTHPYLDKLVQEKFLHETTLSNYSNFESLQLCRAIDDGIKEHNIFRGQGHSLFDLYEQGWRSTIQKYNYARAGGQVTQLGTNPTGACYPTHTVIFQPPFDFWTKHQRCSGGNHQVTLNLRAPDGAVAAASDAGAGGSRWGLYAATTCVGSAFAEAATQLKDTARAGVSVSAIRAIGADAGVTDVAGVKTAFGGLVGADQVAFLDAAKRYSHGAGGAAPTDLTVGKCLNMEIHRIRLMRRMVRFTIERPIATQEFNLTEMQLYVGQPDAKSMTQNFLLPSSTFGLIFFWRKPNNSQYDVFNDFPTVGLDANGAQQDATKNFMLDEFYFTYGGETYPSQRINSIAGLPEPSATGVTTPAGYQKLQLLTNQLMGTYNMPMEYLNTSYSGQGLMERLDSQMFFFPVAKHSNSDNSDLQVYWSGAIHSNSASVDTAAVPPILQSSGGTETASLCVVALYDARIELSYNAANQLEKVTKTEWK